MLRRILEKLRWSGPRHVYLGQVAVVPRSSFVRTFSELLDVVSRDRTESELREYLLDWLELPSIPNRAPERNELGLDVFICGYRTGQGIFGNIFGIPAFVFWRPRMELRARLYRLDTGALVSVFDVTRKMPWRMFWSRLLSLKYLLVGWSIADAKDMEMLLGESLISLLNQVRKAV